MTNQEIQEINRLRIHQCPEWDFLLIDSSCPEFKSCLCFESNEPLGGSDDDETLEPYFNDTGDFGDCRKSDLDELLDTYPEEE